MFQSKLSISKKTSPILKKDLEKFLGKNQSIHCKALKRKISLEKLPEVITERKSSAKKRLSCFWVALDIIKHNKNFTLREHQNNREFCIQGVSSDKKRIEIHLREEVTMNKDKRIYFISCFYK